MTDRDLRALSTGEFGRLAGLSVKALRLYEASGLLPPAEVDPASGYRRYAPEQLDRARRISLLRRVDMPLAVVAEVLSGSDTDAVARLDRWWAAQEQAMQARRGSMGWLRAQLLAGHGSEPAYEVRRRDVPATKVAAIRYETDQQGLLESIRRGQWEIRGHLDAAGATSTAEHWVIYRGPVTPDTEAPIEVCVPFSGTADPAGDMVIRLEPAHTQAYATVARDDCYYPRIMQAYEAVEAYVAGRSLLAAAPVREVYIAAWDAVRGADPFVHVALPVQEA